MRAVSVTIHNFRSIVDAEIALSPYGLLVGENNSGKSNFIDAIRAFYEKGVKFDHARDFPKTGATDDESWMEIEFKPNSSELDELKPEYRLPSDTFRVRKYFVATSKEADGTTIRNGLYAHVGGQLSDNRFYGFKNVGQGKFGDIIYIPAVSKLDDQTKLSGPSPLRDLVSTILKRVMERSPSYQDLTDSFSKFEGGIKNETTDEGVSLETIEAAITGELEDWGASFRLTVNAIGLDDIVKNLVGYEIRDAAIGKGMSASSFGQGFQRSLIVSLIRIAAKYTAAPAKKAKKDFSPSLTWILFEEPEAFLHPNQIDSLNGDLSSLLADECSQVLLTTHNPQFVSKKIEDLPGLVRLHRDLGVTKAHQITEGVLAGILAQNQTVLPIWQNAGMKIDSDDLTTDMEAVKYLLWLDPRRCGAFFAEKVLLVEGPTEVALTNYLLEQGILKKPQQSFFVLDTIGKFNMHRFMNLFDHLGVRHYVLHDDDNGKHGVVDQTIKSAANARTGGIDTFTQDVEAFLGIAPAKEKHRKPQHVMFHISRGTVTAASLGQLASKIANLIGT